MKECHERMVDQRTFDPEVSLFSEAEGGPKFKGLEEGESLTKVWLTVFCCIDQWGQAVQLIIYEAKKGNMRICVWPCHR